MDLTESPAEQTFRKDLRSWLEANRPEPFDGDTHSPEYVEYLNKWQFELAQGGWLGITWPVEYGGRGLSPAEQAIFLEEMALHEAPSYLGRLGIALVGPTIALLGTEEQKQRYLKKMLFGEEIWAQGFSEPNAGSDLGSLSMRAVRDGDDFIVNGQKTWTSYAHLSDYIFLLVRTDPDVHKYKGLTCLLVDLKLEGVSTRPLRMLSGDANFNEVFFSDVRVPVSQVLGEIDGGWSVAITALMHERANLGGGMAVEMARVFDGIVEAARGRNATDDPLVREKIAQAFLELEVYRMTSARAQSKIGRGEMPGPEGSILKLMWSNLNQRMAQSTMEILGPYGQLTEGEFGLLSYNYLRSRGNSIEAGTTEILKNTIAYRVLGMPKSY